MDSNLLELSEEGKKVQKKANAHKPLAKCACQMSLVTLWIKLTKQYVKIHTGALRRGTLAVCRVAVLLSFLCSIPVNKVPPCGIMVISNPTACGVCAFKPTVFSETELFVVLRHQQYCPVNMRTTRYGGGSVQLCDVFILRKIVEVMTLIVPYKIYYMRHWFCLIFIPPS